MNASSAKYDASGRRTRNSAGTSFLFDGANPTQELSGSTVTANIWTGGVDEFFQRTDSSATVAPLTDALGSVLALADGSGNLRSQYTYDPFGATTASGTSSNNPSQYTGRENDGNGLYYYRARYYSSVMGRFISEDPIGFLGGINQYAYTEDSPVNFADAFGTDKNGDNASSFWGAFKVVNRCASDHASTLSLAALSGTQGSLLGQLVLGNDASSLSTVIAGPSTPDPPGTPPIGSQAGWSTIGLLTSNPAGKDFVGLGLNAVGTIPNLLAPTQFVLGVNGAGTYFAKSAFKPGIGTTALGKTLLKFIGQAFMVKAAYDGIVYTGALVSCGQGSGHFTTLGDYF